MFNVTKDGEILSGGFGSKKEAKGERDKLRGPVPVDADGVPRKSHNVNIVVSRSANHWRGVSDFIAAHMVSHRIGGRRYHIAAV